MKGEEADCNRMDLRGSYAARRSPLLPFVIGSLAGVAAVLLLAPQSRRESADRISDLARELKRRATTGVDAARDRVSSLVARGRGELDQQRTAVEAGFEAYSARARQDD